MKHGHLRLPEAGDYTAQVYYLGFYIDCKFNFQPHVKFFCLNSFLFISVVWSIRDQEETSVLIELIRVLVLSRVDFCTSLSYGLPNFLLEKLQRVINSAARLIFRSVTVDTNLVPQAVTLVAN